MINGFAAWMEEMRRQLQEPDTAVAKAQLNALMQQVQAQQQTAIQQMAYAGEQVTAAREAPALAVRIVCPVCTKALWSGMCRSGGDLRNANWTQIEPHLRKHVADDGVASATVTVEVMVDL